MLMRKNNDIFLVCFRTSGRTFVSHDMSNNTKKKMKKKQHEFALGLFYIEGVSEILRPFTQVIVDAIFVALSNATSVAPEFAVKISLQAGSLGATREWRSRELLLLVRPGR